MIRSLDGLFTSKPALPSLAATAIDGVLAEPDAEQIETESELSFVSVLGQITLAQVQQPSPLVMAASLSVPDQADYTVSEHIINWESGASKETLPREEVHWIPVLGSAEAYALPAETEHARMFNEQPLEPNRQPLGPNEPLAEPNRRSGAPTALKQMPTGIVQPETGTPPPGTSRAGDVRGAAYVSIDQPEVGRASAAVLPFHPIEVDKINENRDFVRSPQASEGTPITTPREEANDSVRSLPLQRESESGPFRRVAESSDIFRTEISQATKALLNIVRTFSFPPFDRKEGAAPWQTRPSLLTQPVENTGVRETAVISKTDSAEPAKATDAIPAQQGEQQGAHAATGLLVNKSSERQVSLQVDRPTATAVSMTALPEKATVVAASGLRSSSDQRTDDPLQQRDKTQVSRELSEEEDVQAGPATRQTRLAATTPHAEPVREHELSAEPTRPSTPEMRDVPHVNKHQTSFSEGLPAAKPLPVKNIPEDFARNLVLKISDELKAHIEGRSSEVRVMMKPEAMGELSLRVMMEDGKLAARMEVSQMAVKVALEAQLPQLREALVQQGIDVQRFDIVSDNTARFDQSKEGSAFHQRQSAKRLTEADQPEQFDTVKFFGYNTVEYII